MRRVVDEAWGLPLGTLQAHDRRLPLPFQRALCILTMVEELGLSRDEACRAMNRDQSGFGNMRRLVIREVAHSARARRLVAEFLAALDRVREAV